MVLPEAAAREEIDAGLVEAGWLVQDYDQLNLQAGRGIAVREFPLETGHGLRGLPALRGWPDPDSTLQAFRNTPA